MADTPTRRSLAMPVILAMSAFALALILDGYIPAWVEQAGRLKSKSALATVLKWPGHAVFIAVVAGLVALLHRGTWRSALRLAAAACASGLAYSVIKWLVGRRRPFRVPGFGPFDFSPLAGGLGGLFVPPPNLCFPSGHTTLAFSSATILAQFAPRYRVLFFGWASLTGIERVLENAHYPSDVVAGACLGIVIGTLAMRWPGREGAER